MSSQVVIPNARRRHGGTVQRGRNSLAKDRNWRVVREDVAGKHFEGFFLAGGKLYPGKATVSRSSIRLKLRHPPTGLRYHPHWECFTSKKDGWFSIHHRRQASLEAAILEIEYILNEALTLSAAIDQPGRRRQRTIDASPIVRFFEGLFQ